MANLLGTRANSVEHVEQGGVLREVGHGRSMMGIADHAPSVNHHDQRHATQFEKAHLLPVEARHLVLRV